MSHSDYYSVLGLDENASQEEIRSAYRALALKYHPDRNKGDPSATEKMKELNEAYAVLSNPSKKTEYDLTRARYGAQASERYRQEHSPGDIFAGSDIDQVFSEFARQFGFRNFEEIFRDAYGSDYQTFIIRGPGMFGRAYVTYRTGGSGQAEQNVRPLAPAAPPGLAGRLFKLVLKKTTGLELAERGKDWKDKIKLSPALARDGGEVEYPYKKWRKPRNLMVRIPQGIKEGQSIRLKGMGGAGKGGGEPGDLYLRVRFKISCLQRIKALFHIGTRFSG